MGNFRLSADEIAEPAGLPALAAGAGAARQHRRRLEEGRHGQRPRAVRRTAVRQLPRRQRTRRHDGAGADADRRQGAPRLALQLPEGSASRAAGHADAAVPPDRRPGARSHGVPARGISLGATPAPSRRRCAYQDARVVAAGRAVFERRGCASCHQLPAIKATGRIGPSLAGIADRDPDELPYGSNIVRHTTDNYIFLKVLLPDTLGQPSTMPTFGFTPADAAKIALALASIRKADLPASYVLRPSGAGAVPSGGPLRRARRRAIGA